MQNYGTLPFLSTNNIMQAISRYILYGGRFTRALMVEMVMAEGDINYELREIDIVQKQHQSPEFLAINPSGWVPALITPDGQTLYETHAINLYLAERHRLAQIAPEVSEPERGLFLSGLFSICDDLEPIMKRYFYPHRYVVRAEDSPIMKEAALEEALNRFKVLDQRLSQNGPYHLGDRFSLVDIAMSFWTATIEHLGVLDPYPAIRQCMELVMQRPKIRPQFDEQSAWNKEAIQSVDWSMV
jgi:glutathione S-transferase